MKISIKNCIVAAFLFSLVAFYGHLSTAQAQGTWKLSEVRVFNKIDGRNGTVVSESYDATGGYTDIQLSGDIVGACPGGFEKVRFTWKFAGDINDAVPGGGVSASLDGRQISKSQNCRDGLTASSFMEMRGTSGGSSKYFSPDQYSQLDGERFLTNINPRIYGAQLTQSGTASVKVNTHKFDPKKSWAYFEVSINVPTQEGGGPLYYIYLYENTGGASTNSGGGGGGGNSGDLTVEYDTDRMGGDYKDFDLPRADFELCRAACARDSNCKAYTYVKPDIQSTSARCWLKSGVPGAGASSCCISGVKSQRRSSLVKKFLLDLLANKPFAFFRDAG